VGCRLDGEHPVSARARCPGCGACQEYVAIRAALTRRKRELREGRLG